MEEITTAARLDYAMKHFVFIADQRIKTFNYYAILLAASGGATITVVEKITSIGLIICGALHLLIALMFFMIDKRNMRLLKIAKDGLVFVESSEPWPPELRLATRDGEESQSKAGRFFRYRTAFNIAFAAQAVLGIGALYCGIFVPHKSQSSANQTDKAATTAMIEKKATTPQK